MKLYVWNEPYRVDYGSTMVFAVAETVEEAKAIACSKAATWCSFGTPEDGEYEHRDWSHFELGDPTRIVDLPCAEWHEWSE